MQDYYFILDLESHHRSPSIPSDVVKSAYKKALLRFHPDKRINSLAIDQSNSTVSIDDLTLAFKTLSDPTLKAEYDRLLGSNYLNDTYGRVHRTGLETVDLDSLIYDEQSQTWSRSCRCGDETGFIVSEANLEQGIEDGEITIGCRGCSLWLRITYSVEE